jgi:hypothetical protein
MALSLPAAQATAGRVAVLGPVLGVWRTARSGDGRRDLQNRGKDPIKSKAALV